MAARTRRGTLDKPWDEGVRAKIKTSMLVNRLEKFALSDGEENVLDSNKIKAIEILLAKTLPNVSLVEANTSTEITTVAPTPETPEEWAARHAAERAASVDATETRQ